MNIYDYSPYYMVAMIYTQFICDNCRKELLDHPTMKFEDNGWEKAFGEYAKSLGWLCEWEEEANTWTTFCPSCAMMPALQRANPELQ